MAGIKILTLETKYRNSLFSILKAGMNDIYLPKVRGGLKLGPMVYKDEVNPNCLTGQYWHAVVYGRMHKLHQ